MANASRMAAWEFSGTELKRRHENAELTRTEPGTRIFASGGRTGQFEQAIRKPREEAARRIDGVLKTDGIFERLHRKPIADRRHADYFAATAELERLAAGIREFAPALIPCADSRTAADGYVCESRHGDDEPVRAGRARGGQGVRPRGARGHSRGRCTPCVSGVPARERTAYPGRRSGRHGRAVAARRGTGRGADGAGAGAAVRGGASSVMTGDSRITECEDAPPTGPAEAAHPGNPPADPAVGARARPAYDPPGAAAPSPEAPPSVER
ncbi:transcriptional regulator [Streptomyces glaucus]|uniref:transcriptional regulator n=1 Tax=Streptomyces glaucus TaxID=284029 RepID=UPI003CD0A8B6